jgi:hypothetical protein
VTSFGVVGFHALFAEALWPWHVVSTCIVSLQFGQVGPFISLLIRKIYKFYTLTSWSNVQPAMPLMIQYQPWDP